MHVKEVRIYRDYKLVRLLKDVIVFTRDKDGQLSLLVYNEKEELKAFVNVGDFGYGVWDYEITY